MNHNVSTYVREEPSAPIIKNWITISIAAGVALFAIFSAMPSADAGVFLPEQFTIFSTVPPNGDLNPYGVAFVPQGFQSGTGPLRPGQILVSNFNNNANLQGTGTTIVRVSSSGTPFVFFRWAASPGWINWSWSFDRTGNTAEGVRDCGKRAFN